ncbi:hypothetical protein P22_3319 [Propionispora sp. 2/2-37]|uniref:LapA family protein n=1 Tax=Propionispora sp. 2/2-37 TaxID=1677858 RepID=UPI0006BB7D60|nr:LapA family protein [Propionispora sp. 2/2-37]CUH97192.1 hypothetical protein P22_3319 [Propionispora sp. 2/2-37]
MPYILLVSALVFAFLIAMFAVQNSTVVTVNLLMWNMESSLVLVILGTAIVGFLSALTLQLFVQLKLRYRLHKAQRRISQLEADLSKHQELPPEEPALKQRETIQS